MYFRTGKPQPPGDHRNLIMGYMTQNVLQFAQQRQQSARCPGVFLNDGSDQRDTVFWRCVQTCLLVVKGGFPLRPMCPGSLF